ncbi:hypothetical protein FHW17_002551 [Phyllobacterium sp. P30BS-XVII]|nr:hypothetical protein [Phyllobacterium sp. P30BS-XVII]
MAPSRPLSFFFARAMGRECWRPQQMQVSHDVDEANFWRHK